MFRSLAQLEGSVAGGADHGRAVSARCTELSAPAADLVPLAFLGVLLCGIYQWTGSLYPCIALHVLNNSISLGADEHWGWRLVSWSPERCSRSRSCCGSCV